MSKASGASDGKSRVSGVTPLDAPAIRQWLATLASAETDAKDGTARGPFRRMRRKTLPHEGELAAINNNLAGEFGRSRPEDVLRRMLALGTVQYVKSVGRIPGDATAGDVIIDVVAFALWSVVQAPTLPEGWQGFWP